MIRFLLSNNIELQSGKTIFFPDCSVGLAESTQLYVVADHELSILNVELLSENFSLFKVNNDSTILSSTNQNVVDVEKLHQDEMFVYKINIMFEPETYGKFKSSMQVQADDDYIFYFEGSSIEIDEKLVVTLQNLKKFIDDDYVTAFKDSVLNSTSTNAELYNRKMREYLMNIHDLSAMNGSYKSLFAAIDFFGYGQLLELREYWVSNDKFKSTNIANAVLPYIDKSLAGFKKTNQMSLTYQISEISGYDDDSLPIYHNVIEDADNILVKMNALRRLLEKDFLPFNTTIVDIIGEFQVMSGAEFLLHINNLRSDVVNVNSISTKFEYVSEDIEILNHKVIVKPWVFEKSGASEIAIIDNVVSAKHDKMFFNIDRIVNDDFEEFDMLTTYLNSDFGLIEINVDVDIEKYQSMSISVFENDVKLHESANLKLRDVIKDNKILFGIRKEGRYSIVFALIDYYGSSNFFKNDNVKVSYNDLRIRLGQYDDLGDYSPFEAWTTFESTTGKSVPSAISTTLDINTWDSVENFPEMMLSKKYATSYDMLSTYRSLNNLNGLSLKRLKDIPLISWSNTYVVAMIDCYRINSNYAGFIYSDTEKTVNVVIKNSGSKLVVLNKIVQKCNELLSDEFTFDIVPYSSNPLDAIQNATYCIRMRSIQVGYKTSFIKNIQPIVGVAEYKNTAVFSNVDATMQFPVTKQSIDNLIIFIGDNKKVVVDAQISNVDDIINLFDDDDELSKLYYFKSEYENYETFTIYSPVDIKIIHSSIGGTYFDVARSKNLSRIRTIQSGSDIQTGQPFFACIDNSRKTEIQNIEWSLIESLTGDVVSVQKALAFRYVFTLSGIYNLQCDLAYRGLQKSMTINGAIIVN